MALHIGTVWEVRTTGNNNNGGGWHDEGGASADHTQQDAHNETWTNLSISGTTLTDDDAGGNFAASMLGNVINILTKGRFEITTVTDSDNVELDRAPGDGSGLTGYEGGAVADLEEIDTGCPMGTIHVKAGDYTLASQIYFSLAQAGTRFIIGYNTTRGDAPVGDNRPRMICGTTYNARFFTANTISHIRFEGSISGNLVWFSNGYCKLINCYVRNSNALTNKYAVLPGTSCVIMDCDLMCDNGIAIGTGNNAVVGNHIHDSKIGMLASAGSRITGNIFDTIWDYGVNTLGNSSLFQHNTVYNVTNEGVREVGEWCLVINNQLVSCGTGIKTTSTQKRSHFDFNNYYNNDTDNDGFTKGDGATANNPGFAGAISGTDLVCSDHTGPVYTVTSATGVFHANMAGKSITITDTGAGGHFVVGNYMVAAYVSVTEITLETDPTDGTNDTGGDWESCYDFSGVDDDDGFGIRLGVG